jgi:NAD(P)-dependent dehydrogenase (short-subunit alcohol dehydrogenase family)
VRLDGRKTLVTGAGRGFGRAIALGLAREGADVAVHFNSSAAGAAAVVEEIGALGREAFAVRADLTSWDEIRALAAEVFDRFGRVDVLVNNVGDFHPLVRFAKSTPESWDAMYQVNLRHFFSVTRAFLDPMIEGGGGSIVNVHSVEGMRGYPGEPVYGSMKAAVAHFTTCLAVEMGRQGVRVNAIGPDLTQSPQVDYTPVSEHDHMWESWAPVGRLGWPEDQARVALFLASDMSSWVTGHNIPTDGGTKAGGGWFWSPSARRFVNRPLTL